MCRTGAPLHPDHIFKINIGVNQIEMIHIEELYQKLQRLQSALTSFEPNQPLSFVFEELGAGVNNELSIREMRGLCKISGKTQYDINALTTGDLQQALLKLLSKKPPKTMRELSPDGFSALCRMLMPEVENDAAVFTGRKITHVSICGYKTMGDRGVFDPSRNLHELLQTFPDMQKPADWHNYFEMLAHVAVRKIFSPPTR